jgi:hypothetical protein
MYAPWPIPGIVFGVYCPDQVMQQRTAAAFRTPSNLSVPPIFVIAADLGLDFLSDSLGMGSNNPPSPPRPPPAASLQEGDAFCGIFVNMVNGLGHLRAAAASADVDTDMVDGININDKFAFVFEQNMAAGYPLVATSFNQTPVTVNGTQIPIAQVI